MKRKLYPQDWTDLRVLQILFGDEECAGAVNRDIVSIRNPNEDSPAAAIEDQRVGTPEIGGPLSPIAEEESLESLDTMLTHTDPDLYALLCETREDLTSVVEEIDEEEHMSEDTGSSVLDDRIPLNLVIPSEAVLVLSVLELSLIHI